VEKCGHIPSTFLLLGGYKNKCSSQKKIQWIQIARWRRMSEKQQQEENIKVSNQTEVSSTTATREQRCQEVAALDHSDLEYKVNLLLAFAVEHCTLGDSLEIDVDWDSPEPKKPITVYWTLRHEAGKSLDTCFEERWPILEKYLQPQFRLRFGHFCFQSNTVVATID